MNQLLVPAAPAVIWVQATSYVGLAPPSVRNALQQALTNYHKGTLVADNYLQYVPTTTVDFVGADISTYPDFRIYIPVRDSINSLNKKVGQNYAATDANLLFEVYQNGLPPPANLSPLLTDPTSYTLLWTAAACSNPSGTLFYCSITRSLILLPRLET